MNKKLYAQKLSVLSALVGLTTMSCMPEDDFRELEVLAPSPSLALPILNTNLKVSDLIKTEEGGLLEEKADGSYSLYYRKNIKTQSIGEFFPAIPQQQHSESFSLGISAPAFVFEPDPVSFDGIIPMNLGSLKLYGIECKQGDLNVSVNSEYEHDIQVKLSLWDVVDENNNPLVLDFDLPAWGVRSASAFNELSGYFINIDEGELDYSVEVSLQGTGREIRDSDQLTFDISISELDFTYIEGNFDGLVVPIDADTLDIPILAGAVHGDVSLNPSLNIDLHNSFGIKVRPDLSNIYVKRKSGTIVRLEDEGENNFFTGEFEFPYLTDRNELPLILSQNVSRNNSNIEDAFAELPQGIAFQFGFALDSNPEDTSFITDESSIGIDMEVELPLEGSFDILLEDTLQVDLGAEQEIEALKVLIKTENSFPIGADLQVYFLDDQNEIINGSDGNPLALFKEEAQFLKPAQIINSTTGETQAMAVDMPLAATLGKDRVQMIQDAGSILVRARMQSKSDDNNLVKLYSSYGIRFSLAMQIASSLNVSN